LDMRTPTIGSFPVAGRPLLGLSFIDFAMDLGLSQKQAGGKLRTTGPALTRPRGRINSMANADSMRSTVRHE
jgi:hypothetical protein